MVVVGGELTLEYLDLVYSPSLRYYEAPPHLKANGGVFLVDDFGRERVSPLQLLNRFITPMEHHFDYFTLSTGQKILVRMGRDNAARVKAKLREIRGELVAAGRR